MRWPMYVFLGLLINLPVFAQKEFRTVTDITAFDYFQGVEIQGLKSRVQPYGGCTVGINRSIFQGAFYPRLTLGLFIDEDDEGAIKFGPVVAESVSLVRVMNKVEPDVYNELYAGAMLQIGKRWKCSFRFLGGWLYHRFASVDGFYVVNSIGCSGSIGIGYVFEE
jgi:hypothetical protein